MKDYLTPTTWHIPYTTIECSCGQTFEFETELMAHIDRYLPEEVKEKQFNLFKEVRSGDTKIKN